MALSLIRTIRRGLGGPVAVLLAAIFATTSALAGEAEIRKALAERLPGLGQVDEVTKLPIAGLYEVRVGVEVYYTDENGNYLIEGQLLDTRTRTNLTEARVAKLTAIDFASLPLKDAIVWKQGDGSRKLVVFADPNCGYCKRFEREARTVKNVTIYTFLYPILGNDSVDKSRNIWCAKDRGKVWADWMVDNTLPPKVMSDCDSSALQRNAALGRKHKVNGTPALVFEDGKRVPGAMKIEDLEKQLLASAKKPG
ncbi:MAG: DsbC family protein [Burkholderiaceae bacterium]|nr:DsbC family protein [Burkholderiaceae bacterium]